MSMMAEPVKLVRLTDDARGEPITVDDFHGHVVAHCADTLAMLARERATQPLASVPDIESAIRRQREAVFSLESDTSAHVATWWEGAAESADPWKVWAALFVLGSVEGVDAREGILRVLDAIPADDERWMHASEALAMTTVSASLAHELARSTSGPARAVGIDLLSRQGGLSAEALREHLSTSEPVVAAAAARAAARLAIANALEPELRRCARAEDGGAAWEAARALTLAGVREPYLEVQSGGRLAAVLGARAVELLVMAGEDSDIDAFEAIIARLPMTPELLSAIARFGNVTVWSFLAHHLADPALGDAAVAALHTLFGDIVPLDEETSFSSWRGAIADAELDPTMRYRAGKPGLPALVVAECMSGALSRVEVERRVDELLARTGARASIDLDGWEADMRRALTSLAVAIEARNARWSPGAWR